MSTPPFRASPSLLRNLSSSLCSPEVDGCVRRYPQPHRHRPSEQATCWGSVQCVADARYRVSQQRPADSSSALTAGQVERGGDVEATISRKKRTTPPVEPKVTGEVEARLIALACSAPPPEGHARWSLRLLEKHVALIDGIPDLDHSTIGKVLKRGRFALI